MNEIKENYPRYFSVLPELVQKKDFRGLNFLLK